MRHIRSFKTESSSNENVPSVQISIWIHFRKALTRVFLFVCFLFVVVFCLFCCFCFCRDLTFGFDRFKFCSTGRPGNNPGWRFTARCNPFHVSTQRAWFTFFGTPVPFLLFFLFSPQSATLFSKKLKIHGKTWPRSAYQIKPKSCHASHIPVCRIKPRRAYLDRGSRSVGERGFSFVAPNYCQSSERHCSSRRIGCDLGSQVCDPNWPPMSGHKK